jgi:hypothetical protein
VLDGDHKEQTVLTLVPLLDEICAHPDRVHDLEFGVLTALMAKAASAQNLLAAEALARMIDSRGARPTSGHQSDQGDLISIEAAVPILGRSKNWILRNRNKKHLPFIRQVSDKTLIVSESSLRKWIEGRPVSARTLDTNITDSYNGSYAGQSDQGTPRR